MAVDRFVLHPVAGELSGGVGWRVEGFGGGQVFAFLTVGLVASPGRPTVPADGLACPSGGFGLDRRTFGVGSHAALPGCLGGLRAWGPEKVCYYGRLLCSRLCAKPEHRIGRTTLVPLQGPCPCEPHWAQAWAQVQSRTGSAPPLRHSSTRESSTRRGWKRYRRTSGGGWGSESWTWRTTLQERV